MKWFTILIAIGLLSAIVIGKAHSFIFRLWPETVSVDASQWFYKPPLCDRPAPCLNVLWWLKGVTDDLTLVIYSFIMTVLASLINRKLYWVMICIFAYHIFNVGMFLYDYKQTRATFDVAQVLLLLAILIILFLRLKRREATILEF